MNKGLSRVASNPLPWLVNGLVVLQHCTPRLSDEYGSLELFYSIRSRVYHFPDTLRFNLNVIFEDMGLLFDG